MLPRRLARLLAALPVAAALAAPGLTAPATVAASCANPCQAWTASIGSGSLPNNGVWEPYSSPAVGRLRGTTSEVEIVAGSLDGWVRVFHSNGTPDWQKFTGGPIQASPTLADLRGDGTLDVIVTSRNGYINVYNPDGSPFGGHWPMNPTNIGNWGAATNFGTGFLSSAAVGSLFGDGLQDVVVTSQDHRIYAFDANGNLLPGWPINLWDTIFDTPVLVDLEGRGQRDIVVGSDSNGGVEPFPKGGVWWAFRPDGSQIWTRWQDEVPWSSPSAAILNPGDIQPSVVTGTGHYFNQTLSSSRGNYVNVFNANGTDRFGHSLSTPKPNFASPALGDLLNRNDGSREIVEVSEDTSISVWDGNGNLLWRPPNINGNQLGSPIIAPLGGGDCGGGNGVWLPGNHIVGYCYGTAGTTPDVNIATPGPSFGGPVVADLGNGQLSLVAIYAGAPMTNFSSAGNTPWTLGVWNLTGTSTIPAGAWPTVHGSMQRTGMLPVLPDPRNSTFVENVYHDVLHRTSPPAQSEIDYWTGRLNNGAYRSWVALALVGSSEAHGFTVDNDYQTLLNRPPDPSGRAYWVSQLDAGVYNERLLGLLGGSDEYFNDHGDDYTSLVLGLYHDVLGRTSNPPAQDVNYWVSQLQGGLSRGYIGQFFANSHEYHMNLVASWYEAYLFRAPDPPGQTFWADFLDSGRRDDVGIVQLVASTEYFNHSLPAGW